MNTDNAAMILAPTPPRQLVCAECGTGFACGSGGREGGCWCADEAFRLPMPADGKDCLCPACLRAAARAGGQIA